MAIEGGNHFTARAPFALHQSIGSSARRKAVGIGTLLRAKLPSESGGKSAAVIDARSSKIIACMTI
jgi:hypothetical protein